MLARFARFVLTGIANSLVGWAVIFAGLMAGLTAVAANVAGYGVGLLLSFTLNRHYVFGVRGAVSGGEVMRFLVVFFLAFAVNLAVLLGSAHVFGLSPMMAQVPAIVAYTAVFFLLSQLFVFRRADSE
jgi:putative flippase GtrA